MKKDLFGNTLAADMDKVLNSKENKNLFSSAATLEKLAFKKVSEPDTTTEVEIDMTKSLSKVASAKCDKCDKDSKCNVDGCSKDCVCNKKFTSASDIVSTLLKVSADFDSAGFSKLAATTILLVEGFISQAKAKKSEKGSAAKKDTDSKSSKKLDEKKNDKSKASKPAGKKMDMKERMKKMREMNDKKKGKGSKTVSKTVSKSVSKKK